MKKILNKKIAARKRIHRRIRMSGVHGTMERPRLSFFKSNTNFYAQLIDDESSKTLIGVDSIKSTKKGVEKAIELGKNIAEKSKAKNIRKVIFDRGGFLYIGNVKAFADSARAAGLEF